MATWALNLIARYPGERFQPYAGVGFGIFWARISGQDIGTSSDVSPGLNALGGMRFSLTERLALFGEYKYNQAAFDFGSNVTLYTLYQAHHFVGGLSFQFWSRLALTFTPFLPLIHGRVSGYDLRYQAWRLF